MSDYKGKYFVYHGVFIQTDDDKIGFLLDPKADVLFDKFEKDAGTLCDAINALPLEWRQTMIDSVFKQQVAH